MMLNVPTFVVNLRALNLQSLKHKVINSIHYLQRLILSLLTAKQSNFEDEILVLTEAQNAGVTTGTGSSTPIDLSRTGKLIEVYSTKDYSYFYLPSNLFEETSVEFSCHQAYLHEEYYVAITGISEKDLYWDYAAATKPRRLPVFESICPSPTFV